MTAAVDPQWVESMPVAYDEWLAPVVFRPFAVDLARRAAACSPRRVLEVAAGTGVLTRELVTTLPGAEVVATDLSPAMVEFGARQVPAATWRPADAMDLPLDEGAFDLVTHQFGAMFFPDKVAAFVEAGRVLATSGTLLFNVWASLDTHDCETALTSALARVFPDDPPQFFAVGPHGYADRDAVVADLEAAGFHCRSAETITVTGRAASAAGLATGYCTGTPLRAAIHARTTDPSAATAAIAAELTALLGSGEVTGAMAAHVFEATTA
jgi:SAM-dependent methyltransferase